MHFLLPYSYAMNCKWVSTPPYNYRGEFDKIGIQIMAKLNVP